MRKIDEIIIHCSDSDRPEHDDIKVIDQWHKERGFKKVGYHYFIKKNGDLQIGREESEMGAHCASHNQNSIGICLHGKKDLPTWEQTRTLLFLCRELMTKYDIDPMNIHGHREYNEHKTCPNFDVKLELLPFLV